MAAPGTEIFPAGNEWVFSERNQHTSDQPGLGKTEIVSPFPLLASMIDHLQDRFLTDGWQFRSVIQNLKRKDDGFASLQVVFTHPERTKLVDAREISIDEYDIYGLIRPEHLEALDQTLLSKTIAVDNPINTILAGTMEAFSMGASFNCIYQRESKYIQTGVGILEVGLRSYKIGQSSVDRKIQEEGEKLNALQRVKARLIVLQSAPPRELFQ